MSAAAARLVLLTREGCGLCEEMQQALAVLASRHPHLPAWTLQDVDDDPVLARRSMQLMAEQVMPRVRQALGQ